jgi:hypothetical protein
MLLRHWTLFECRCVSVSPRLPVKVVADIGKLRSVVASVVALAPSLHHLTNALSRMLSALFLDDYCFRVCRKPDLIC